MLSPSGFLFLVHLQRKRTCPVASSIKLVWPSFLSRAFFSSFLPISRRIWISLSFPSLFLSFIGYSGRTIKMKIFGPRHERTANGWSVLQSADGTGFQRREDAWCIRHARRYNATVSHEITDEERGRKDRRCKNKSYFCRPLIALCDHARLCFIPCIILSYLIRREHLRYLTFSGHAIKIHLSDSRRVWRLKSDREFLFDSKSR